MAESAPKYEDTQPLDDVPKYEETLPHPDDIGMGESALRGAGQGLSLGFSDELMGGAKALGDVATSDKTLSDLQELYSQYKNQERQKNEAAKLAHPWAYGGGELAGGLGTAFVPGLGAATLGKAALLGAGAGLGYSNANLEQGDVAQAGKDAAIGVGAGVVGHGLGELASKAVKATQPFFGKAAKSLGTEAEESAMGTLGADRAAFEKEIGGNSIFTPVDHHKGIGEEALAHLKLGGGKEGVLTSAQGTFTDTHNLKTTLLDTANKNLNTKLQNTDTRIIEDLSKDSIVTQGRVFRDKLIDDISKGENPETVNRVSNFLDDKLEALSKVEEGPDVIKNLEKWKKTLGATLTDRAFQQRQGELAIDDQALRGVYDLIKKRIEGLTKFSMGEAAETELKRLNMKESNLIDLATILQKSRAKSKASTSTGGDIFAAGAGMALGQAVPVVGPYVGAALGWGTKKLGERMLGYNAGELGHLAATKLLQGGSKIASGIAESPTLGQTASNLAQGEVREELVPKIEKAATPQKLSQNLYSASNDDLSNAAEKLKSDPTYASYGEALQKSMQDGSSLNKNAVLFSVLQNPHMRKLLYEQ